MNEAFTLPPAFSVDPPSLYGSFDPETGQTYFPPRPLSVDGRLRRLDVVPLDSEGVLSSFTAMGPAVYGQVDLPSKVRILATLSPGEYTLGDRCRLEIVPGVEGKPDSWRFTHA